MSYIFKLSFLCDNAAFCTDNAPTQETAAPEIVRILRAVADRTEAGDKFDTFRNVQDVNGNIIGTFAMKKQG